MNYRPVHRLLSLMLVVCMLASLVCVPVNAAETVTFTGDTVTCNAGETVDYSVSVSKNAGLAGYHVNIYYDNAALTPVTSAGNLSVTQGNAFANGTVVTRIDDSGYFEVLWYNARDVVTNSTMFTVRFIANTVGKHDIRLEVVPEDNVNTNLEVVPVTTVNGSITVKPIYTLSFDANGGSGAPASVTKQEGTEVTISTVKPTRAKYTFLGWATTKEATTAEYQPGGKYTITGNVTLYAVWEKTPETYTVTYNANGGAGAPGTMTKTENVVLTLSDKIPTRSQYAFLGWATTRTATKAEYEPGDSYTENASVTLYAVWERTYTITYNANGGTGVPPATTKRASTPTTLSETAPTREGYKFLGWATTRTATKAEYQPGDSYAENLNVTLYAVWEKIPEIYTVTYDANGGENPPEAAEKTENVAFTLSETVPTREGYNFLGWATTRTATKAEYQPGGSYTKNASVTLYAVWQGVYSVTYDANGGENAPEAAEKLENEAFTLSETVPTRENYKFLGWATTRTATKAEYQPGGSYTKNASVTLYAVWQRIYTVTYHANGGENAPEAAEKLENKAFTISEVIPTRENYQFLGWATSEDGAAVYQPGSSYTENADLTLYAVWHKFYTITYNANRGEDAPEAGIKLEGVAASITDAVPNRKNYKFLGWATIEDAKNAEYQPGSSYELDADVTLYAVWEEIPVGIEVTLDKTTLISGQFAVLSAKAYPEEYAAEKITFEFQNPTNALRPTDCPYASILLNRLTAKTVTERTEVIVVAKAKNNPDVPDKEITVTILPKATGVTLSLGGKELVPNATESVDLNAPADSYTFSAKVAPEVAEQSVTWTVSGTAFEKTAEDGKLTLRLKDGAAPGSAVVTATTSRENGSKSARMTLKLDRLATGVNILVPGQEPDAEGFYHVNAGSRIMLTTDVADQKQTPGLTNRTVNWTLSEDSIPYASIDTRGTLTTFPVAQVQTVTVTASTLNGKTSMVNVRVYPALEEIQIGALPATKNVNENEGKILLTAKAIPETANKLTIEKKCWRSSNPRVADIVEEDGQFYLKALTAGKVKVTFVDTATRKQATSNEVTFLAPSSRIAVAPNGKYPDGNILRDGQSLAFQATVWSSNTVKAANQKVIWEVKQVVDDEEYDTTTATISNGRLTVRNVSVNTDIVVRAKQLVDDDYVTGESQILHIKPKLVNNTTQTLVLFTEHQSGKWERVYGSDWMRLGETMQISAAWYDSESGMYTEISNDCSISVSNARVVSINGGSIVQNEGVLKAIAAGSVTITATCKDISGKNQTATVKLESRIPVDHVEIQKKNVNFNVTGGGSLTLRATALSGDVDSRGNPIKATNQKITWRIREISPEEEECEKLGKPYEGDTTFSTETAHAKIDANGRLTTKAVDRNVRIVVRADADYSERQWNIDYADLVVVTVRPRQVYQATIYLTKDGVKTPITGIQTLTTNLANDNPLKEGTLSVELYVSDKNSPNDGACFTFTGSNITWESRNPNVAEVKDGKLVLGGTVGTAVITAKVKLDDKEYKPTFTVKTVVAAETVTITRKTAGNLYSGKTLMLAAEVNKDLPKATNSRVNWRSSNPAVATVSNGNVRAGKVYQQTTVRIYADPQDGLKTFTAKDNNYIELTIYPTASTVNILSNGKVMNNRTIELKQGDTLCLSATVYPTGDKGADQNVKWSGGNSVIKLDANGHVTVADNARKGSTITVRATTLDGSNKYASFKIIVK